MTTFECLFDNSIELSISMKKKNLILIFLTIIQCSMEQTIKNLDEIELEEETPIGSLVCWLNEKIANLDQSIEYDLVKPLSNKLDLFSINHEQQSLIVKKRIDFEELCSGKRCSMNVNIAVSREDTIDLFVLPIVILNKNDNFLRFPVNQTLIEIDENDELFATRRYSLPRAFDADGEPIFYSIFFQNWSKPLGLFEFENSTHSLRPLKSFDREENQIFLLRFLAASSNEVSIDLIVLINDLNDNRPKCPETKEFFLSFNSTVFLNASDDDQGENARLEFEIRRASDAFSVDRLTGLIRFEPKLFRRNNETNLEVRISDRGKPTPLSTSCFVALRYENYFQIEFSQNFPSESNIFLVENLEQSIGRFQIFDPFEQKFCDDCRISIEFSSVEKIFLLDSKNFDLFFNLNSVVFMKILTNSTIQREDFRVEFRVKVQDRISANISTVKLFSFRFQIDKNKFQRIFLRLDENLPLKSQIPLSNYDHPCLQNRTESIWLVDPTKTFSIDSDLNLLLEKRLVAEQKSIFYLTVQRRTDKKMVCSVNFQIYVVDPYSVDSIYLTRRFCVLSLDEISSFVLNSTFSHVEYRSSVEELIFVDPRNGSMSIRSNSLFSRSFFDFRIDAIDHRTSSLSSSMFVRLVFHSNEEAPRLLKNSTNLPIELDASRFIFQLEATDPDLFLDDQSFVLPPTVEFSVEPSEIVRVEPFTGRVFLKQFDGKSLNLTVVVTDFGRPKRFSSKEFLLLEIKTAEHFPPTLTLFFGSIFLVALILLVLLVVTVCCCSSQQTKPSKTNENNWNNISPNTADSRLIDNEYFVNSSNTLSKEHRLSIDEINKYLERFERIYNETPRNENFQQSIGSVV